MSESIFENAWRFLKMTDVRILPSQFNQLGESMNIPEIQQLIDPDPAINMDTYNYLGDRRLGPLEGKHYAGGYDVMRGRSKGKQVNAPDYLEMNLNQPFSADTLTALRDAGFTAFSRKMPDISDSAMHYRIKGGSHINRPATDEEKMRITSHPAGGGVDVNLLAEIKRRQLAENIANREKGINPNLAYREQELQRRREETQRRRREEEEERQRIYNLPENVEARRIKAERLARQRAEQAERERIYNLPENVEKRRLEAEQRERDRIAREEAKAKADAEAKAKRMKEFAEKAAAARKKREIEEYNSDENVRRRKLAAEKARRKSRKIKPARGGRR